MCHDEGFTLDENGKIALYNKENATAIREMTLSDCLRLRYAGTDSATCTFEEYIEICKDNGKIAYITIRDKYMGELIPELLRILEQYEMVDRAIINSFTYNSLKAVRESAPSITLSYVQPYNTRITKEDIDDARVLGNCIVCGFNFGAGSTVADVKAVVDTSVIAYAQENKVLLYEAQIHSKEIAKELEEYGYSGMQMMVEP